MSYSIKGKRITLTRGDTLITKVSISNADGTPYEMQEGDSLRFKMTDIPGGVALIVKEIPSDTLTLKIDPSDTNVLPFGEYFFDLQLTYANGNVETILAEGQFDVTAETDAIVLGMYAPDGGE